MIINLNENFDGFNFDDLDGGDYSYFIDTFNSLDTTEDEEQAPLF